MNERDKDIYESGVFCGTLDERQRIIKLLEDKLASCDWEQVAKDAGYDDQVCDGCDENRAVIELIKGETK